MMSYFLSMQRASWKWRVVAFLFMAISIDPLRHEWIDARGNLASLNWYDWSVIIVDAGVLCVAFVVGVVGRVPKFLTVRPGSLNQTLSQIHADIAKEQREQQEKSREL
jgi:hypothetical protein